MTELRVYHNNQMLVFSGINQTTCLQPVGNKSRVNNSIYPFVQHKAFVDNNGNNSHLNDEISKTIQFRAQTALNFLGQKYSPYPKNELFASTVLTGHNFTSCKSRENTMLLIRDKTTNNYESNHWKSNDNHRILTRGKSAPVVSIKQLLVENLPEESFSIKSALNKSEDTTTIKVTKDTTAIISESIHSKLFFENKPDDTNRHLNVPSIPYPTRQSVNSDKLSLERKRNEKQASYFNPPQNYHHVGYCHLLPLMWSEDLAPNSLLGHRKGRTPFQACLTTNKQSN